MEAKGPLLTGTVVASAGVDDTGQGGAGITRPAGRSRRGLPAPAAPSRGERNSQHPTLSGRHSALLRGPAPGALGAPWLLHQRILTPPATAVTFAPCGNFLAAKGSGTLRDCRCSCTGKEERSGDSTRVVSESGSQTARQRFSFRPVSSTEKSWGDPSSEPPRGGSRGEPSSWSSSQDLALCLRASPLPVGSPCPCL